MNLITEIQAREAIEAAEKHASNGSLLESSAQLCLSDAKRCFERGAFNYAHYRATDSLRYSVGIFHSDYKKINDIYLN